jgi:hypothetical protein
MKIKILYTVVLLLGSTLLASPNRNTADCAMRKCNTEALAQSSAKDHADVYGEDIPAVTSFLPGYSILYIN